MTALEIRGASFRFGSRSELHDIDLSIEAGQRVVVFGLSGSGKRALARLAAGIAHPTSGTVTVADSPLPVGYVTNEGGLLANMSLLENVVLPVVYHRRLSRPDALAQGRQMFSMFGIPAFADRRPSAAGVGARRLAQVARAVLARPKLYVLEEPFYELDAAAEASLRRILDRIGRDQDSAALISTGQPKKLLRWGDRFVLLRDGKLKEIGDRAALSASEDPDVRTFLE